MQLQYEAFWYYGGFLGGIYSSHHSKFTVTATKVFITSDKFRNSIVSQLERKKTPDPLNHLGKTLCIASVMMRWMATFVDHLLLSLIAFSRFILLRNPTLGKMLFDGQGGNSMENL